MAQKRDVEGMGIPEIKYGESMCFVQHVSTGLWLTYASLDAKAARLGMMKRKVGVYTNLNENNCNETEIYDKENEGHKAVMLSIIRSFCTRRVIWMTP